jgi:hypothetical protein
MRRAPQKTNLRPMMPGTPCPARRITNSKWHRSCLDGDILLKWTPYSQERLGLVLLFAQNSKVTRAGADGLGDGACFASPRGARQTEMKNLREMTLVRGFIARARGRTRALFSGLGRRGCTCRPVGSGPRSQPRHARPASGAKRPALDSPVPTAYATLGIRLGVARPTPVRPHARLALRPGALAPSGCLGWAALAHSATTCMACLRANEGMPAARDGVATPVRANASTRDCAREPIRISDSYLALGAQISRRAASALMCARSASPSRRECRQSVRGARPEGRKIRGQSASLRCVLRGGYSRDSTEIGRPAASGAESQQHTREY